MAARETFLITGANGFIGGWLAETLHLRDGVPIRAGMRSWSTVSYTPLTLPTIYSV